MPVIRITSADDPRIAEYRDVPDPELVRRRGLFVAEGRIVVRRLLESARFHTRSVLVTETALEPLRDAIAPRLDAIDVFVVDRAELMTTRGLQFHRGCLALGERPGPPVAQSASDLGLADLGLDEPGAHQVLVLDAIANADNVGGLFRNAAAFGVRAVLLDSRSCDPLYRKATRTSMGATLTVPFAVVDDLPTTLAALRAHGFALIALAATGAVDLEQAAARWRGQRIAVIVGSESTGLDPAVIALADACVSIAMAPGIDSLNVATAAGIALCRLASPDRLTSGA